VRPLRGSLVASAAKEEGHGSPRFGGLVCQLPSALN